MDLKFKPKNEKMKNQLLNRTTPQEQKEALEDQAEYKRLWSHSTEMKCEACEGCHFDIVYKIRFVSKLVSGYNADSVLKPFIPVPMCTECGHVNTMFEQPLPTTIENNG